MHPPAPLDGQRLGDALAGHASVDLRWGCPSTLDALRAPLPALPHFVVSEWQWAGRGRQGRRWQSPLSGNYYIALACRIDAVPAQLPTLPLLLGVAIAEKLRAIGLPVRLKWPNDVVIDGRKLGGLLVELEPRHGELLARIGVGLNWRLPATARARIDRESCDLADQCPRLPERTGLLITLLQGMLEAVQALQQGRSAQWLARWRTLDSLLGQRLRVLQVERPLEGLADSVDGSGRLRLLTADGLRLLDVGEVERVYAAESVGAAAPP